MRIISTQLTLWANVQAFYALPLLLTHSKKGGENWKTRKIFALHRIVSVNWIMSTMRTHINAFVRIEYIGNQLLESTAFFQIKWLCYGIEGLNYINSVSFSLLCIFLVPFLLEFNFFFTDCIQFMTLPMIVARNAAYRHLVWTYWNAHMCSKSK